MQFKDVVGQSEVKKSLIQTVLENRISHAQLYYEKQGSGALPLALAYAQYIACDNRTTEDSCGECSSCLKYSKLEHPDLHSFYPVNANTKITSAALSKHFAEEWRNFVRNQPYGNLYSWLRVLEIEHKQAIISAADSQQIINSLTLKSYESPYKVCLIWLVEKLNGPASNKLLKILEEPPEKTLFILITQDYEALLPTILSRTQMIRVAALTPHEIGAALIKNQAIDAETADKLSYLAEGDYNKAIILSQHGYDEELLMTAFRNWMLLCVKREVINITYWVEDFSKSGRINHLNFLQFSLTMFRKALMQNFSQAAIVNLLNHEKDFIVKFSKFVHEGNTIALIEEFGSAIFHIERNVNAKLVFMDLSLKVIQLLIKKNPQFITN